MVERCWGDSDELMASYHDTEWGVPLHDDRALFELLVLEGFQAGLSWTTVLRKREAFREAFDGFDVAKVAVYGEAKVAQLLDDASIIRNRAKISAAISNAGALMEVQDEFGSFDAYIWGFVDGTPIQNDLEDFKQMPAKTELSEHISKDLKARGFRFIGPTIVYAFMQSIGMVNDHLVHCYRYRDLKG
jgi:DNA-3-methyladenine glycosylase I